MKKVAVLSIIVCLFISGVSFSDTFGTGSNQFEIDFVSISGDASSANGTFIGDDRTFSDPINDFRIGTYEITNDQWDKFAASLGVPVLGHPATSYDTDSIYTGSNMPANYVIWYEAAQFVNWLNTSNGFQAAYKFTGAQGTINYTFQPWESGDTGYNPDNPFRNSNAFYFLPTEDEWVKAAYWNGVSLQQYATNASEMIHQGDGVSGTGWNYYDNGFVSDPYGPWDVGSGSEELNGTFDMMGNVWEWTESPYFDGGYYSTSYRCLRGGHFGAYDYLLTSTTRQANVPHSENKVFGFRVASVIPEPCTLSFLALGGVLLRRKKYKS